MFKTINLTGTEQAVKFAGKHQYFHVHSLGGEVLVSLASGIERGKDGVLIVQGGGAGYVQNDMASDTVYLAGSGEVQVAATGNAFSPFNSGSKGGGNGGTTSEGGTVSGTVDYPIIALNLYGESVQDSTPTPENPVDIISVGDDGAVEVIACGKNLLEHVMANMTAQGITFKVNPDKSITANGTATGNVVIEINHNFVFQQGKKYIMSSGLAPDTISGVAYLAILDGKGAYPNSDVVIEQNATTTEKIAVVVEKGTTVTNAVFKPMIRLEDTDDTYEPYTGSTATITSGLPLCSVGSICDELIYNADGTGKIIKRTGIEIFDGSNEENWVLDKNYNRIRTNLISTIISTEFFDVLCDKLTVTTAANTYLGNEGIAVDTVGNVCVSISALVGNSNLTAWTSYLTNNPLTVIYQLATPQEIELSAAEMSELMQLQTYNGVTNIFNDEGAEMTVKVATNPLLSEYVKPVIEGITARYEARIAALESAVANN